MGRFVKFIGRFDRLVGRFDRLGGNFTFVGRVGNFLPGLVRTTGLTYKIMHNFHNGFLKQKIFSYIYTKYIDIYSLQNPIISCLNKNALFQLKHARP